MANEVIQTINTSAYAKLSVERKLTQENNELPEWFTTGGWQMFKAKYLYEVDTFNQQIDRIAKTAAEHLPQDIRADYRYRFFKMLYNGWLACSTPVLANMGTDRGMPVSCSGNYIPDSIDGFYTSYHELAMLTKYGFGTSSFLSDIRPRGSEISKGGKASGTDDVVTSCVDVMVKVAQGTARRGAWAGYLDIEHGDFDEVCTSLRNFPDDMNMGWNISQSFIDKLENGDEEAHRRIDLAMSTKAITGKGYFYFVDKVADLQPDWYKKHGLRSLASNLCTEITLHSDENHTYTCVLSSLNLAKYDEWKDTTTVQDAIVFLDCVASEFIRMATGKKGFEKAVNFTRKSRALGLGTLGFHTMLQDKSIAFESFEAHSLNNQVFSHIKTEAVKATEWLAEVLGEPVWMQGTGRRNSHLLAIAPNTSSALICGGVSQGIEPVVANIYNQSTAAGELYRVNPSFLKIAKERGKFNDELVSDLLDTNGSVQHLDWLSDHEKLVFKTAYEIDQKAILRLAAARQQYICQAQSLNLFFDAEESEDYIMEVHREAFLNPMIKSLYYMRTLPGVQASKGECVACEG